MSNELETSGDLSAGATTTTTGDLSLLDRIVQEGRMAVDPSQGSYARKLLGQLATQILDEGMKTSPDKGLVNAINDRVAEIDKILSDQLNAILHDPAFQALEASWHGLHDMVFGTETSTRRRAGAKCLP